MKLLLSIAFLASALTAQAGTCNGTQYIRGTAAVSGMVLAYKGYKKNGYNAYVRAIHLERANAQTIYTRTQRTNSPIAATPQMEQATRQIQQNDKVVISYRLNAEANHRHFIQTLEEEIQMLRQRIERNAPNANAARIRLGGVEEELAHVRSGKYPSPQYTLEVELPKTNQVDVAAKITDLSRDGSKVTRITRIPRVTVAQIARASKNGWVLLAVAAGLGFVAKEESLSNKIACRRETELNNL